MVRQRLVVPPWLAEWLLPALLLAGLFLKLAVVGDAVTPDPRPSAGAPLWATLALLAVTAVPLSMLRGRARLRGALAINVLGTAVAMVDLWHGRFYGDVASITDAAAIRQLPAVAGSVLTLIHPIDAAALFDIAIVLALGRWVAFVPSRSHQRLSRLRPILVAALVAAIAGALTLRVVGGDPDGVFEYGFQRRDVAAVVGLAGYHAYDLAIQVRYPIRGRLGTREADLVALETMVRARQRDEIVSRLFGVAQGRNVILVNAESLQAFTIGLLVKGQPVTPNLTAFAKESLHFTEFYDQTYMGTTSDAEYITLNSLMALPSGSVATRYGANGFRALPYVLTERGYHTLSACAEPPSVWNMRQMHARYGFAHSLFLPDFKMGEWTNVQVDDASFFQQMAPLLAAQRDPFFAFMLTSSNHHPYRSPARPRDPGSVSLPRSMAEDYLQSVRRFDDAFGVLIRRLASSGLLDRSVVVLYGDHQSWVEDDDLQGLWLSAGHSSPATPFELWRFRRKIPLLIRLPGGAEAGPRDIAGGHLDITPTLLSLLGVPGPTGPWLGRDLTAPRRGVVVFRDGSVTDGQATALAGLGGTARCHGAAGQPLPCEALAEMRAEGRMLLDASDRMIAGNLATAVTGRLKTGAQSAPRKPGPVLVIAHRGDSIHYPENTLASIRSAFDVGADVVEVDVRLSKDGVPMVFHDEDVDRTSDGHGPFAALALREVKALDVGMWQHPRFAGVRVPTLEEALLEARGRGRLYLDLAVDGLSGPIARTFARLGVSPQEALVATWTSDQRAEFARDMPGARLVRVERAPNAWSGSFFRQLEADGVWGFEIGDERSPAFVGDAARHGVRLLVYTVNDEPTMRRLIEMGVSGIETDDPALLLKVAASLGAR